MLKIDVELGLGDLDLAVKLELEPGITGLFGPSGAGKTTLLHALAGLRHPARGRIALAGKVLYDSERGIDLAPEHRRVAVAFQEPRLFPHLSVEANLFYGCRSGRASPFGADPDAVVDMLDLGELLERHVTMLSGGEAQRVGLARALLSTPGLLLLDEPLSAVDRGRRRAALECLRRAHRDVGMPMLYVSHSFAEIQDIATSVVFLEQGRVLASGSVGDVLTDARTFELASRVGLESVLVVEVGGQRDGTATASLGPHTLIAPQTDLEAGSEGRLAVRPRDVIVARRAPEAVSARNALPGRVGALLHLSDRCVVTVEIAGGDGQAVRAEVTEESVANLGLHPGSEVVVLLKTFAFEWL